MGWIKYNTKNVPKIDRRDGSLGIAVVTPRQIPESRRDIRYVHDERKKLLDNALISRHFMKYTLDIILLELWLLELPW